MGTASTAAGSRATRYLAALSRKGEPHVVQALSDPRVDRMVGDAAAAYAPADGLKRFVRRLYFVKPDALIVVDDIELDRPHQLDLVFHPENAPVAQPDNSLLCSGQHTTLRVEHLTPEAGTVTCHQITIKARADQGLPKPSAPEIDIALQGQLWRDAVAFTWSAEAAPPRVTLDRSGQTWTFHVGDKRVTLDWAEPPVK